MRAYVLASGLLFMAAAAWAALPSHQDLTRALDERPDNPVIAEQAAEVLRVCCRDDWESFDRRGYVELPSGSLSSDLEPGPFTAGWDPASVHRPARQPVVYGYTQAYEAQPFRFR
jgi:hypothetical protein